MLSVACREEAGSQQHVLTRTSGPHETSHLRAGGEPAPPTPPPPSWVSGAWGQSPGRPRGLFRNQVYRTGLREAGHEWGGLCSEVVVGSSQIQETGGGVRWVEFGVTPTDSKLGNRGDRKTGLGNAGSSWYPGRTCGGEAAPNCTLRFGGADHANNLGFYSWEKAGLATQRWRCQGPEGGVVRSGAFCWRGRRGPALGVENRGLSGLCPVVGVGEEPCAALAYSACGVEPWPGRVWKGPFIQHRGRPSRRKGWSGHFQHAEL